MVSRRGNDNQAILWLVLGLALGRFDDLEEDDGELYYLFRRFLRDSQQDERDQELLHLVENIIYRRRRSPERRRHEIAAFLMPHIMERFKGESSDLFSAINGHISALEGQVGGIISNLSKQSAKISSVAMDAQTAFWLSSTGADISKTRMRRYIPVRIYVSDPVPTPDALEKLCSSLERFAESLSFEKSEELPGEEGSWWKRIFLKTKEILSHEEVAQNLEKARVSIELIKLDKPQAEINKLHSDAAIPLIKEISGIDGDCCMQIGSLLLVKSVQSGGQRILVKTLSPIQLKHIEENPAILGAPEKVLEMLQITCSTSCPT